MFGYIEIDPSFKKKNLETTVLQQNRLIYIYIYIYIYLKKMNEEEFGGVNLNKESKSILE
ncbi:MAG: hypothetical protein MCS20_01485 [Candidatus Phytoplasma mali]|nr:hypothetical protein [Candidatus Phytoplasma australiense]MCG7202067.1 hypothetical protein [Candidatus Phytoplasma mali]